MLTYLTVENFRCLKKVEIGFSPFTVLIGPNDSGKSSLLDSLLVIKMLANDGLMRNRHPGQKWLEKRYDLVKAIGGRSARDDRCEFRLRYGDSKQAGESFQYRLTVGIQGKDDVFIQDESLYDKSNKIAWLSEGKIHHLDGGKEQIGGAEEKMDRRLISLTSSVSIPERLRKRWFPFRSILLFSLNPKALAEPCPIKADGVPMVDRDGTGLAALLDYYLGSERERFDAILKDLRGFSSLIEDILIRPAQTDSTHGVGKAVEFRLLDGTEIPAWQASDGLLFTLGYLALIHSPEPPMAILVEEPENGIHPDNLGMIVNLFRRLTEGDFGDRPVQVIIATHSPYLLDHAEPEEVRVVTRSTESGTRVTQLSDLPDLKEKLRDFKLGELWTAFGDENIGHGARS